MQIAKIDNKVKLSRIKALEFHINFHCFINNIDVTPLDIKCIALLAVNEYPYLQEFCKASTGGRTNLDYSLKLFKNGQTARNSVRRLEQKGLLEKRGGSRKKRVYTTFLKEDLSKESFLLSINILCLNG